MATRRWLVWICLTGVTLAGCSGNVKPLVTPAAKVPTEESIRHLIAVTQFDVALMEIVNRGNAILVTKVEQLVANRHLNSEQVRMVEEFTGKVTVVMDDELSWRRVEPIVVSTFQEDYSQAEVDALIVFYTSGVGKDVVGNIPRAVEMFNQENFDAWEAVRHTQGEQAYRDRISHDLQYALQPKDLNGLLAFYESDIGRQIAASASNAKPHMKQGTQALADEAGTRWQALLTEYKAQLKAVEVSQ
jgi:hypothetical protein